MSTGSEKSVVVIGEKKFVNRLLLEHARLQGDYDKLEDLPHMYQTTRSYPYIINDEEKKTKFEISIKVFAVFEEEVFFRKAVLDTLNADIFIFVYSASSLDSLDEIRDKYIYEIREYEDKHFSLSSDVMELYDEEDERPRIPLVLCGVSKKGKKVLDKHTIEDCEEDVRSDLSIMVDFGDENTVKDAFRQVSIKCHEFTPILEKTRKKLEEKKKAAEKKLRQRIKEKHERIRERSDSQKKRKNTFFGKTKRLFKPPLKIFHSSRNSAKVQINEAMKNIEKYQDKSLLDDEEGEESEGEEYYEDGVDESVLGQEQEGEEDAPFELVNLPFENYNELPHFLTVVFRCIKKYDYVKGVFDFDQDTEKAVEDIVRTMKKGTRRIFLNKFSEKVLLYLVKIVLQSFPQPLCSFGLYEDFLRTNLIKDRMRKIEAFQNVLSELPARDKEILGILVLMFKHIEKTLPDAVTAKSEGSFNHLIVLNDISLFLAPIILYSRPPSMVRFLEEKKCVFFMIKEAENIILPQFKSKEEARVVEEEDEFNDDHVDTFLAVQSPMPYGRSLHSILRIESDDALDEKNIGGKRVITEEQIQEFDWVYDLETLPEGFDLEGLMISRDQKEMDKAREAREGKSTPPKKKEEEEEEGEEEEFIEDLLENESKVSVEREEEMVKRVREYKMKEFWKLIDEKEQEYQYYEGNYEEGEWEGEYNDEEEEVEGEWFYDDEEGEYYFRDFNEEEEELPPIPPPPKEEEEEEEEGEEGEKGKELEDLFADWEVGVCIPKDYNSDAQSLVHGFRFFLKTFQFIEDSMKKLLSNRTSIKSGDSKKQEMTLLRRRVVDVEKFLETVGGEDYKSLKKFVEDEEKNLESLNSMLEKAKEILGEEEEEEEVKRVSVDSTKDEEEEKLNRLLAEYEYAHQKLINQRTRFNVIMQMFEDGIQEGTNLQKRIEEQKREIQVARNVFDKYEREIQDYKRENKDLESQLSMIKVKNFENFLMF